VVVVMVRLLRVQGICLVCGILLLVQGFLKVARKTLHVGGVLMEEGLIQSVVELTLVVPLIMVDNMHNISASLR
jgi:hypothetical protein